MNKDELLELKKDVDELSMYYASIKKEIEELEEVLYANNIRKVEVSNDLTDEEIISKYKSKTLVIYWGIYLSLVLCRKFLKDCLFGISAVLGNTFEFIYISSLFSLLAWYFYRLYKGSNKAPEKYRKKHPEQEEIDYEEVKQKLQILYEREEIIRTKYNEYENKYQKEISCLEDKERQLYNEYISEYMLELLTNADDKLNLSMLISDMSDEVFTEDIEKKYELK